MPVKIAAAELSVIAGYDATRSIRGVVFENQAINGVMYFDGMKKRVFPHLRASRESAP